jgi:hypothetical protein
MTISTIDLVKRAVQVATPGSNVLGRSGIVTAGRLPVATAAGTIADSQIASATITGVLTWAKLGTSARTITVQDADTTVAGINLAQTWTAAQTFNTGTTVIGTADINGGAIDATAIGATTPAAAAVTTLAVSSTTSITGGQYVYLRGDATTDGSVRMSSDVAGELLIERRTSGSWVQTGRFA